MSIDNVRKLSKWLRKVNEWEKVSKWLWKVSECEKAFKMTKEGQC